MAFRIIQWSFLLGLAFYSLFIGAAQVSLSDLWQMDGEQLQFWWEIMLQSRIPRLCSILVVGSSLAISGLRKASVRDVSVTGSRMFRTGESAVTVIGELH